MREFETGATRDSDENKLDFEGFLSPVVLEAYANYMHKNRLQADGKLRDSDNWQKGIPIDAYMKSMWRHFFAVWKGHRSGNLHDEELCALLFNVMGMLHERIKERERPTKEQLEADWNKALETARRVYTPYVEPQKIAPGGALGKPPAGLVPNGPIHGYVPNLKASDGE